MGRLFVMDLGGGAAMLVIEQDGEAMSYPLDGDEASRVSRWLSTRSAGRPRGSVQPAPGSIDYEAVAALYQSDEAGESGDRMTYTAERLGISHTTTQGRVARAKELGLITKTFRNTSGR
jgi:hypothetical protein